MRSTSTAWIFIATSSEPSDAPNASRTIPSVSGVLTMVRNGRITARPNPAATMIGLLPYRALSAPVITIAITDPRPRQSSNRPSTPSSTPSRCLAKGTSGAQHATPKPATRKARRVASRAAGWSNVIVTGVLSELAARSQAGGRLGLHHRWAGFRQGRTLRARQVVFDDHAFDRLERGDAMRRARIELVGEREHHAVLAGRENRAFERRVGESECADPALRRYRTRADEASIDIQFGDGLHRVRIDASAHGRIDRSADHDEMQIGPAQHGGRDVDGIGRHGEFAFLRQHVDEGEVGAAAVEEQQLA